MNIRFLLFVLCVMSVSPLLGDINAYYQNQTFIWDQEDELKLNWLLDDWRHPNESCITICTAENNPMTTPEAIKKISRVRIFSDTSDVSRLMLLPRTVKKLECDIRGIMDCSFLQSLSLEELRIVVPLTSNFNLKMLSHMPMKRLLIANAGKTKDYWDPLSNMPLEALCVTNAGFHDVKIFAKLRVKQLSLVNCVFMEDPLPFIAKNSNLRELQIGYSLDFNNQFLNDLMNWGELKKLQLRKLYVASPSIDFCRDMGTLRELYWLTTKNSADCSPLKNKALHTLTITNLTTAEQQCNAYNIKATKMHIGTELKMENLRRQWNLKKKHKKR